MDYEIKNALIKSTMLGREDHNIMTFVLNLEYSKGSCQGAGCYSLGGKSYDIIKEILDLVGVRSWEELPGSYIQVKANHGHVKAIGNFLKDEWLDFEEFFKEMK